MYARDTCVKERSRKKEREGKNRVEIGRQSIVSQDPIELHGSILFTKLIYI